MQIPQEYENAIGKTDPHLSLAEHTRDVIGEARRLLSVGYCEKYRRLLSLDLEKRLLRAALFHDAGKLVPTWQEHAQEGNLIDVGMRHEMASIFRTGRPEGFNQYLWPEQKVAILAHHGKLSHRHSGRFKDAKEFKGLWQKMRQLDQTTSDFGVAMRRRYRFSTVRGLLSAADRRASEKEKGGEPAPIRAFTYEFPHDDRHGPQKEAEALPEVAALRAETGSGKTDAALLWAKAHGANRVIFAMPTRFTATSLAEDIEGGLFHSAASTKISKADLQASDRFLPPTVVTTIDQVLMALTGRTEKQHMRFANLADSVVVFDEIDAYDEFVQGNIQVLSRALSAIEVPHLAMSATLPSSFVTDLLVEGAHLTDVTESEEGFRVASIREVAKDETPLPGRIEEVGKAIVYANTVGRAIGYYQALSREDKILYHARFTRPDRSEIESEILKMIGGEDEGTGGVVVMTQAGEMSLNVTCDLMVSDLCPIDRLAQRTGRMKRFSEGKDGVLHVVHPSGYPAPYGEYAAGEWTASKAWTRTSGLLEEGQRISKSHLRDMTEQVYSDGVDLGAQARDNARRLQEDEIVGNWLIQPKAGTDETGEGEWKSRNIRGRVTIVVGEPPDLLTQREFWRLQLTRGVSLQQYKLSQAREKTVQVGDETKQVPWTDEYDQEIGVQL